MTDKAPTTEPLREALEGSHITDVDSRAYLNPAESYKTGWNDAMDHAARIADSLMASAALAQGIVEPVEGEVGPPVHMPHCNDRCTHYLMADEPKES